MARSKEILDLLDLIDEIDGMSIDYLWGFLHDEVESGSLSGIFKFLDAGEVKLLKTARSLVDKVAKTKEGPVFSRELNNEFIEEVFGVLHKGDEILDEHFTRLELQEIPKTVARWKKLSRIPTVLIPGEKVTDYMRQATTCYLYGLPSAAAVLCRTVLEFALEEKFGEFGGITKLIDKVDKTDYLKKLINFAGSTKILSTDSVKDAHSIREVGNRAIHTSTCTEMEAFEAIKNMGEILSHIYGRTGQRGQ
ncbi:DUF4145 domain-containing protein [Candidatus Methylomirabilis sp.]|uniref:DUF4145 domain-containing protein n=1 Tax=Candidatus Methylomirabilis sp. TaxID=2032687 RepID=UPI003C74BAB6